MPDQKDNVQKVLEELKVRGLVRKKVKAIRKSGSLLNFKASVLRRNRILYNEAFAHLDVDSLRFILLHEEGHHQEKQNSKLVIGVVLVVIGASMLLANYYASVYDATPLPILYGLLPIYVALGIFSLRIFQEPLQEDEFAADLYAARLLMEGYGVKEPSRIVGAALSSVSSLLTKGSLVKRMLHLLFGGMHPNDEERIRHVRTRLEAESR